MDENSRKTLFISISLTLLTMMIVYYSFYTGREIAERYIPLVDASTKVQLKTTTAHLWFEEGISGDRTIDINEVWATLDQSEWYAQAMLDGGTLKKSTFLALNDPNLRKQIEEVIKGIHHFREIAQQRWASKSTSGIGSEIDQQFDQAFLKFSLSVKNVEATLHQAIANDLKTFKFSQKILIFIIFILGLIISVLLLRYKTKNKQNIDTLKLLDKSITESQEQLQNIINGAKLGYWDWYYKTGEHRVNNE